MEDSTNNDLHARPLVIWLIAVVSVAIGLAQLVEAPGRRLLVLLLTSLAGAGTYVGYRRHGGSRYLLYGASVLLFALSIGTIAGVYGAGESASGSSPKPDPPMGSVSPSAGSTAEPGATTPPNTPSTSVTPSLTQSPSAASTRRRGKITLPHDFFSGYSVDLDTKKADWRFSADQYRDGIDMVADCCDIGLTAKNGILRVKPKAEGWANPKMRTECEAATGYTDSVDRPKDDDVFCIKTDEGRVAVGKVLDAGLDTSMVKLDVVVWEV